MYHKLKMMLLKAHTLTRKKLQATGKWNIGSEVSYPLITFEETDTSFQCTLIMDAYTSKLVWPDPKGFRLRAGLAEMTTIEFLEYIKTK